MTCEHLTFDATVRVNRFEDRPGHLSVEVMASCRECSKPVIFRCPRVGLLGDDTAISPFGEELRAPATIGSLNENNSSLS